MKKIKKHLYETIIVGGGIAGCTAAIYASRKRMDYLLVTEDFGGQFLESGEVLNYPGIVQTTGAGFSNIMERQLKFNEVKVQEGIRVEKIVRKGKNFLLQTTKKDYLTQTVILCTGSHPKRLNVLGEEKFRGRGVTYCAICDGPLFKGKEVAVIGGGDSALEAVDFLGKIAKKIYLLVLEDKLKAHEYLQERAKNNPKLKIIYNANTTEILGNKFVERLRYEQKGDKRNKLKELKVQGIFVEIGRVANSDFVKELIKLDEHGHIIADCQTFTSVQGIFAAGDCSSVHEYQYVISAGMACTALLKTARYLAGRK
ncbi:MAG TPA: FAD-dependent oxidoreductase [Candidatus Nanoarchaeia archaeon]|nr:FAD-dependent oxidoreductase [Candidatus Nanoarchaeia archaeon]